MAKPAVQTAEGAAKLSREGAAFKQLQRRISRTNNRLLRAGDALMKDLGLTTARWLVLDLVANGPKTVAQIARHYEQTRQGFLWVVESMARIGQVELHPNPDDRRAKLVRCTAEGLKVYQAAIKRQNAWAESIARGFSIAELVHLAEFLDEIGDAALLAPHREQP
jgi:DNA-binding MarR family transcriptional regulator